MLYENNIHSDDEDAAGVRNIGFDTEFILLFAGNGVIKLHIN